MAAGVEQRHATADPEGGVSPLLQRRLQTAAIALAAYALAGGVLSLSGWVFDLPRVTDWLDTGVSIQPNAAIAVIAAAAGALLLATGRKRGAAACGAVVAFLGGSALFEWVTGLNLGIDSLFLFGRTWGRVGVIEPGRMGPPGALSWTLIGTALLLATKGARPRTWVPALTSITMAISLLSLIGYSYGANILFTLPRATVIAFQTSTFVMAVSLALVLQIPERSPTRRLIDTGASGTLFRRTAPFVVLLPILLGSLSLLGNRRAVYDAAFGTALRTVIEIALLLGLLWWAAEAVARQVARAAEQERAARAADQRLAGMLGNLDDAFVSVDAQWRFTFVNDEGVRRIGLPRERLLGRNIWEVFPEAVGQAPDVALRRAMAERVAVEYEHFQPRLGRWLLDRAYPLADGGLAIFGRDITERKHTRQALEAGERRFRSIFETVAVSLWEEDFSGVIAALDRLKREGVADFRQYFKDHPTFVQEALGLVRVLDVNDATVRMFKATSKEALLGALPDIFGPESLPVFEEELIAIAEGRMEFETEALLKTMQGDRLYVFFTMVLPPSEASRQRALFSVFDMTERRQHEMERVRLLQSERQAREEAERASAVKDEFLATLSHELRTPLNAILGWVRILEKRPDDPAMTSEAIGVIARNARAQADLIADLLDMNRIMSGKVRLELDDVVLFDVIAQSIEAIRPAADAKQIGLTSSLDPSTETVRGDAVRLQQILWNLLSNAVKFTPKGGTVRVSLTRVDGQAEIVVSDTGIGIDPRFLPFVFDRFRQADASTTREHGGLGLGLSIVRHLVDLHGGTVRAVSAGDGRGSTFTIRLPIEPAPLPAVHRPPRRDADGRPALEEVDLEGVTVLAVDDQPDARELLRVVLERCRARVYTASSADEALGLLERARPDIVLCDIGMPGKDGYGFIREVRHRHSQVPALAVTAFAHKEDRIRALRAGYQGQIAKPIEPAELVTVVAAFVRMSRDVASQAARKADR